MIHLLLAALGSGQAPPETSVDFDRQILPILSDHCFECHGPDPSSREADLRLDQRDEVLFVAEPGNPGGSELISRITHANDKFRMPPVSDKNPLTEEEIGLLRTWIQEGVAWESHWAFERPEVVAVGEEADPWCQDPLDHYILLDQRSHGLEPSPPASPQAWLRRVYLDLTGLPPELGELSAFEQALAAGGEEDREAVYAQVVDQLLTSRSHAEHRTRQWLDIARYADTNGYQNDFGRQQWPWRDWVLRAFEGNMPYDRFVLEQVAGDLLPDASTASILATGFQRNHRSVTEVGSIDEEWRVENVADRAETTSTAFLGLTLACARCHDHKYDPLTQEDYYRFFGFFNSIDEKGVYSETRGNVAPLLSLPTEEQTSELEQLTAKLARLTEQLDTLEADTPERHRTWLREAPELSPVQLPRPRLVYSGLDSDGGHTLDGQRGGCPDLGRAVDFEEDRPFSVSLWLYPESGGAVYSRMNDDDSYRGTDLVLFGDLRPAIHLIHQWTENAIKVVGREPLQAEQWQHIAVTYDGTERAAGVTLFVNGRPVAVQVEKDSLDGTLATTEPLRLGTRRYAGELSGRVLDLRVDAVALSEEQILALARPRARGDRDGLAFYLACFDEAARVVQADLSRARLRREQVEGEIATAMVLAELPRPRETRLLDRGLYDQPKGEVLTPDVPAVFGGLGEDHRPDRLGLARWLVDPSNPLTARVAVNRVWAQFFGTGLVGTQDDFGTRGERPSHPELLDRLALDLIESGWDLRALERRIALSATYRQRSGPDRTGSDPGNRLLARGPRKRLDAEEVRDQALAIAGLLAPRWGGPPVKPYQPAGLWKELMGGAGQGAYEPSQGEDLFRRSLYTYRKRTVPHPTLSVFDAPGFELCTVQRDQTNTPLQALATLNDTTYVEAARHFALAMLNAGETVPSRIRFGVRRLLLREPLEEELQILGAALEHHLADFEANPAAARELLGAGFTAPASSERTPTWAAYTLLASTLLNLDETVSPR